MAQLTTPSPTKAAAPDKPPANTQAPAQSLPDAPVAQTTAIIANYPAFLAISDFQQNEVQTLTNLAENICPVIVPRSLTKRKIYGWIWAAFSGGNSTDFSARAEITFWNNQAKLGSMPLTTGLSALNGKVPVSLASVLVINGQNVQDSLGLTIAQPQTVNAQVQPSSIVLQPLYLNGEIDAITISLKELVQVQQVRLYLACISSRP